MIGVTELTRCYERLSTIGLNDLWYESMGIIHPHGMSVPHWELAIAYFYGVTFLVPNTKFDQTIRTRMTSRVGLTSWLEYQRLGVNDSKSAILFQPSY